MARARRVHVIKFVIETSGKGLDKVEPTRSVCLALWTRQLSSHLTLTMQNVSSVRAEIKAWERSYKLENGCEPSVDDIKKLPHIGQ